MVQIKSDLTTQSFPARPMRDFAVSDETQESVGQQNRVMEARMDKMSGKERLSAGAKQRIEMLCGISRMQREVSLDGNQFVLQTLKGKEYREAWISAAKFENTVEFPFELRKQLLSRSLYQIAGAEVELFLQDNSLEARMSFLEDMDESVLNRLYQEYNLLADESKNKYGLNSAKEVAAVTEDLKK